MKKLYKVVFEEIAPPVGAGTRIWKEDGIKIGDWEFTGSKLCISFKTMDEIKTMREKLKKVDSLLKGGIVMLSTQLNEYKCTITITDGEQTEEQDFYVEAETFEEAVEKIKSDLDI